MGLAMGCVGMSMDDFCRCTPSEFQATMEAWRQNRQHQEQDAWERTRMACLCMVQPYSKKRLSPTDIMVFPWEKEKPAKKPAEEEDKTSSEEIKRRYEEAKRRYGLG